MIALYVKWETMMPLQALFLSYLREISVLLYDYLTAHNIERTFHDLSPTVHFSSNSILFVRFSAYIIIL